MTTNSFSLTSGASPPLLFNIYNKLLTIDKTSFLFVIGKSSFPINFTDSANSFDKFKKKCDVLTEDVISVAATGDDDTLAYYTKRTKTDIVAPGGDSSQDYEHDGVVQETFQEFLGFRRFAIGWRYRSLSGTSMATPHVSGVAALIKSIHPEWTPEEVKEALVETAVDLGPAGKDDDYGYGLLNAHEAVSYGN